MNSLENGALMPPAHLPPMRWTRHASSGCSDICEQKKDGMGTHSFSPSRSGALGREQGHRVKPGQSQDKAIPTQDFGDGKNPLGNHKQWVQPRLP